MNNFAHLKWFTEAESVTSQSSLSINEILVITGFIASSLFILYLINKWLDKSGWTKKIDKFFSPLRPWVAPTVRISTGALLLLDALNNVTIAPNVAVSSSMEIYLNTALTVVGILLIIGLFTRATAFALFALYAVAFMFIDSLDLIEHLEYVGLSAYLLIEGAGKLSVDEYISDKKSKFTAYSKHALPLLRIFVGIGFVALAFSEKLFDIPLAQSFLVDYHWNFLSLIGQSDRVFILFAGSMELMIGLALVFNIATRIATLMLLSVMATTAIILGPTEIIGHLFAVGFVVAILVGNFRANEKSTRKR